MTVLNETLEQRLKSLEEEQYRQDWLLEREMTHLKTVLNQREIDDTASAKVRPLGEIDLPAIPSAPSPQVAAAVEWLAETTETTAASPSSTIPQSSLRPAETKEKFR